MARPSSAFEPLTWARQGLAGRSPLGAYTSQQGPFLASLTSAVASWVPLPRFPLPCRGLGRRRWSGGQLTVAQTFAGDFTSKPLESIAVAGLAGVEPEGFFVQVAEEVERLDANVGPLDGTLEQRPEILDAGGVDHPVHVLLGVVDNTVDEVAVKVVVRDEIIGHNLSAFGDVPTNVARQGAAPAVVDHGSADGAVAVWPVPIQQAHDSDLTDWPTSVDGAVSAVRGA